MDSCVLTGADEHGERMRLQFPGVPGMLHVRGNHLLASSQDMLYTVAAGGALQLSCRRMPGHAGRLISWRGKQPGEAMLDRTAQTLYLKLGAGWFPALEGVRDIALSGMPGK
jgi:hypothetical protein